MGFGSMVQFWMLVFCRWCLEFGFWIASTSSCIVVTLRALLIVSSISSSGSQSGRSSFSNTISFVFSFIGMLGW